MRLQNKVALITGASRGIGRAIAIRFAQEGASVAVNYLAGGVNAEQAAEVVQACGGRAIAVPGDVSQRADVEAMVAETVAKLGALHIAVNNAGMEIKRPFLEVPDEEWDKVIAVDLRGPFLVSQVAARQMVKQGGGGKLINISSVHEDIPFPQYAAYGAAKGGVRMLARDLALELAPYKINVNNIAPGAIATPINQAVLDDPQAKRNAVSEIPWGRFGRPEEVAAVALFLASEDSDYVTGSTYYVDGGLTQQVTLY
jgi:glucose 1-dehydrogenase